MTTHYQYTARIVNDRTGQTLKTMHGRTLEGLQRTYDEWKKGAAKHYRLRGFHVVLTKEVSADFDWKLVSSRVGKIEA